MEAEASLTVGCANIIVHPSKGDGATIECVLTIMAQMMSNPAQSDSPQTLYITGQDLARSHHEK